MHMIIFMALVCGARIILQNIWSLCIPNILLRGKKKMNKKKRPLDSLDTKLEETLEISCLLKF